MNLSFAFMLLDKIVDILYSLEKNSSIFGCANHCMGLAWSCLAVGENSTIVAFQALVDNWSAHLWVYETITLVILIDAVKLELGCRRFLLLLFHFVVSCEQLERWWNIRIILLFFLVNQRNFMNLRVIYLVRKLLHSLELLDLPIGSFCLRLEQRPQPDANANVCWMFWF